VITPSLSVEGDVPHSVTLVPVAPELDGVPPVQPMERRCLLQFYSPTKQVNWQTITTSLTTSGTLQ